MTSNLGSIGLMVHDLIPDVPASLSGTPMYRVADRERLFMEAYTGQTIGSVGIEDRFIPALVFLTASSVLGGMQLEGPDVSSIRLGELDVSNSGESGLEKSKAEFKERGMDALKYLGRATKVYRVN